MTPDTPPECTCHYEAPELCKHHGPLLKQELVKAEMTKAVEYLVRAQTDYLAAVGGVEVSGLVVQVQLLVPQLDALVEVLANKGLISREEYWKQCTVKMRDCEGGFRKLVREMPRIQVPGKAPKPS